MGRFQVVLCLVVFTQILKNTISRLDTPILNMFGYIS